MVLDARGAGQRGREFFFHGGDLFFQVLDQLGLLALGEAQGGVFAVLTGAHDLFLELIAPLDERTQFGQVRIGDRCGCGFKRLAEGGKHGGIQRIVTARPPAPGRSAEPGRELTTLTGSWGGLERGDHGAFIAAGGFADQVRAGDGAQELDQAGMTLGGVRQDLLVVLEVELEGGLGDVQAGIDGREVFSHIVNSVRAHTCTCEHVALTAALSTVRVTDMRHERLRLPHERVQTVPEGNERTPRRRPPPLQGRGRPPSSLFGLRPNKEDEKQHTRGDSLLAHWQKSPDGGGSVATGIGLPLRGGEGRALAAPKWLRPRRRGEGECFFHLNSSG